MTFPTDPYTPCQSIFIDGYKRFESIHNFTSTYTTYILLLVIYLQALVIHSEVLPLEYQFGCLMTSRSLSRDTPLPPPFPQVYDFAFTQGKDVFATVGADGSLRMFDLR